MVKKNIPNFITLLNLFFGCVAIVAVLNGQFALVLYCFILSGLMDFADGMVARLLNISSPVGKELDSLADVVSFGVLPGMILFVLLGGQETEFSAGISGINFMPFAGFIFSMAACLRLARFNLDTRQSVDFIGLNTPTATAFVIGLLMLSVHNSPGLAGTIIKPVVLIPVTLVLAYLMLSEFPMFSGKFKGLKWQGNEWRISLLVLTVIEFFIFGYAAFAPIVLTYILLSALALLIKK